MIKDKVGAVIVAAGQGNRMGGVDKVFVKLGVKPLLAVVIDVFHVCDIIDEIVVVLARENLRRGRELEKDCNWTKEITICKGGERRRDSVKEGLGRLTDCQWVVIHDGARPLLDPDLIERGLDEARESGAAAAAVPVKDTIKVVTPDGFVRDTPQRSNLWAAQTPQVFRFDLICEAHDKVVGDVSDDAMMVESLGYKVKLYMGSYENIKVTTPEDLALVETILRNRGD